MSQEDTEDIEVGEPIYQCPDCGGLTIRGKWSIEGAKSLTHARACCAITRTSSSTCAHPASSSRAR